MRVISDLEDLDRTLRYVDAASNDDELRQRLSEFSYQVSVPSTDPFSEEYKKAVLQQYASISEKKYAFENEATEFDHDAALIRPYPFSTGSAFTAGQHFMMLGHLMQQLDVPLGSRVADMGPGWGNSTEFIARLGHHAIAIDVGTAFCRLVRERLARAGLSGDVVQGDFFRIADVGTVRAAVFFESFHHSLDHFDLLKTLRHKLDPDGVLLFGGEPIFSSATTPWGIRPDGMSVWSVRKFGWLELGFSEDYFLSALIRAGWAPSIHRIADISTVYKARKFSTGVNAADVFWPAESDASWAPRETDPSARLRFTSSQTTIATPDDSSSVSLCLRNFKPIPLDVELIGLKSDRVIVESGKELLVNVGVSGRLQILCDAWTPSQELGNDDNRLLGIAISTIRM